MPWNIAPETQAVAPRLVALRRELHRIPELAFKEHKTSKRVAEELRALGLQVETGVAQTGVVGVLDSGKPGPTLAFRADMDALPIQEATGLPFASEHPGAMHACAHDGHTATLLTVAGLLAQAKDSWRGRVVCFFQPAEEGPGGAEPMIRAGVVEQYRPDAILGLHLWTFAEIGTVAASAGPLMASADEFTIVIRGKGGHGALPHTANDTIVTASQVVLALQTLVSRNISPLDSGVVTVGRIQGGTAVNILPETVELHGTVRALSEGVRDTLEARLAQVATASAEAHGCRAEVDYRRGYPVVVNDAAMAAAVAEAASEVLGPERLIDGRTLAGEDMSYWLNAVPGCFFLVGAANRAKGLTEPHHSPRFDIDEDSMLIGADILRRTALGYLA